MAKCCGCSAPLPANTQICSYCGVRNDIDIKGKLRFELAEQQANRTCPECQINLQTIQIEGTELSIERCNQCYGLFFDPHELETLLEKSVDPALDVNIDWLNQINKERYDSTQKIKYRPCAVCGVLMNRVSFARMSGIVVDKCSAHGVWLNNGALSHLLEWRKAGGQILHNQHRHDKPSLNRAAHTDSSLLRERWEDRPIGGLDLTLRDLGDLLRFFI